MSSAAPPITASDGPARARIRDLLALHVVRDALASIRPWKIERGLDVVLAADAARGGELAAFGFARPALAHQLRLVLSEATR